MPFREPFLIVYSYISLLTSQVIPKHFWIRLSFIPKIVLTVNFYLHRTQSRTRLNNQILPSKKYYNYFMLILKFCKYILNH